MAHSPNNYNTHQISPLYTVFNYLDPTYSDSVGEDDSLEALMSSTLVHNGALEIGSIDNLSDGLLGGGEDGFSIHKPRCVCSSIFIEKPIQFLY